MGMDLKPVNPTPDHPRHPADDQYEPNAPIWGRFNWSGWSWLRDFLSQHDRTGIASRLPNSNDGDLISSEDCKAIADLFERELPNLPDNEQDWIRPKIELFRKCGGYLCF